MDLNTFQVYLQNYLSNNTTNHKISEAQIEALLDNNDPKVIEFLFTSFSNQTDESLKQLIIIILKRLFDDKILEKNIKFYESYVFEKSFEIVNSLINLRVSLNNQKIISLILEKLCILFPSIYNADKILEYIFNCYNSNKQIDKINEAFTMLYMLFCFLKLIEKWEISYNFEKQNVYEKLIADFEQIIQIFLLKMDVGFSDMNEYNIYLNYLNLFFKISKHSISFLAYDQREKVMSISYNFLYKFLMNFKQELVSKIFFECIFLANQILIRYCAYSLKITLSTVKMYCVLFYVYIENSDLLKTLLQIIRTNFNESNQKEKKFLVQIVDFFKELLQLTSYDNWGDLILLKNCFSDDQIHISDFLSKEFFTKNRIQNIIIFTINSCFCFTTNEIEMANEIEEFYMYYDNQSPVYDLREKAGLLCRIIFDRYKKEMKDIFNTIEVNILELAEDNYLSSEKINLKCNILCFFESIALLFYDKNIDFKLWVYRILLPILNNPGIEQFSNFLVLRILMKIIDVKNLKEFKIDIFNNVHNIYIKSNSKLLKFGSVDFFYHFFEDMFTKDIQKDFLKDFIKESCILIKSVQSHDIHNRIIKTTSTILAKYNDEDVEVMFHSIIPLLYDLWNVNGFTQSQKQITTISVLRQNVIVLLTIFVKKIGIFFDPEFKFFEFIYNIIGYSISTKFSDSNFIYQEALKLILLIQEEFFLVKTNTINPNDLHQLTTYPLFLKMFDFLGLLLDNLSVSDDYLIIQLLIIEQYCCLKTHETILIFKKLEMKLFYLIKRIIEAHSTSWAFPIYNIVEFLLMSLYNLGNTIPDYISQHIMISLENYGNILSTHNPDQIIQFFGDNLSNLIGILQISNRMLMMNMIKSEVILMKITEITTRIVDCEALRNTLNIVQKKVLSNILYNLINTFSSKFNYATSLTQTRNILLDFKSSVYLDTHNSIIDHWLFFFNKMTNDLYFYQLSALEDEIVYFWKNKFEKTNFYSVDVSEIKFNMKYEYLKNDSVYKNENMNLTKSHEMNI